MPSKSLEYFEIISEAILSNALTPPSRLLEPTSLLWESESEKEAATLEVAEEDVEEEEEEEEEEVEMEIEEEIEVEVDVDMRSMAQESIWFSNTQPGANSATDTPASAALRTERKL